MSVGAVCHGWESSGGVAESEALHSRLPIIELKILRAVLPERRKRAGQSATSSGLGTSQLPSKYAACGEYMRKVAFHPS